MNTAARSPSPLERPARPQATLQQPDSAEHREHADRFDRILRDKIDARSGDSGEERDESGEPPRSDVPMPLPPLRAVEAPLPCSPLMDIAPVAQAAFAAARAAEVAPLPTDTASSWELSLHEPLGVAIEMRATRAVMPVAGGPAPWTLTMSSPTLDAGLLSRHAPRLDDRLRKRVSEHMHVRIQRDDETAP